MQFRPLQKRKKEMRGVNMLTENPVENIVKKVKKHKKEIRSWILTLVIPVIIILLLNAFICKFVVVTGNSMFPTLHTKDLLIVMQVAYAPNSGDIVVIKTNQDSILRGKNIVKRIIALEGQHVVINYDTNTVSVDKKIILEPYINNLVSDPLEEANGENLESYDVPEGCVYVMGDNRNESKDSRSVYIGMVKKENIIGKSVLSIPFGCVLQA